MGKINVGSQYVPVNISQVQTKYNAVYVADLCIKTKLGYSENPVAVFWQETPPQEGYSNYFGLFLLEDKIYICSAESVVEGVWYGSESEDGEIIFSRYRHDYRESADGTAMADGGRDYFRGSGKMVTLNIVGPNFEVVNEES